MGSSILRFNLKASFRNMSTKLLIIALVLLVHQVNAQGGLCPDIDPTACPSEPAVVPEPSPGFFGFLYKFFRDTKKKWEEAETICKTLGGHLASVHSRYEMDFILYNMVGGDFWLGGKRSETNGTIWEWSDETAWDWSDWAENEPSNRGRRQEDKLEAYAKRDYKWNDNRGSERKHFVC